MNQDSISNKLSELFDLFKSGALTKDEYDQLKAKIINKDEVQPIIEKVQEIEPVKEVKKETLPEKVYKDCIYCSKLHDCVEIAMMRAL